MASRSQALWRRLFITSLIGILGFWGILALWPSPAARACSPLSSSDWKARSANVTGGETAVPGDLTLRLRIERYVSIRDHTSLGDSFDPEAFVMTCDGTEVSGTWEVFWPELLWSFPELSLKDGAWRSQVGCPGCEGVWESLQATFAPEEILQEGAQCEVSLTQPCTAPGCQVPEENDYPWEILSFTVGKAPSGALRVGESSTEAMVYSREIQECDYPDPRYHGSCLVCVTKAKESRMGLVFTFPSLHGWDAPDVRGGLLARVFLADTAEGLAEASPITYWLDQTYLASRNDLAIDLGDRAGGPRCAQLYLEDRRGRQSPLTAPLCVDPEKLSWSPGVSGCACRAGSGQGDGALFFGVVLLGLLFLRHRRSLRGSSRAV